jgi:transposase
MPNSGLAIVLQPSERTQLEQWESARGTPQQGALRCRIILRAVAGRQNVAIAEGLGVSRPTVQLWLKRVHEQGIGKVWEIAPGRGRKANYDQGQRDRIIQATFESKPKGMTHWSCQLMAEAQGVSKNTVNRLWQLHNIKPHLSRTFKLSRDAKLLEKLTDVVGLSINPHDKALVLMCGCEEPNASVRSDAAGAAAEKRPVRYHDARLQAQWHHHPVCGTEYVGWQGDWWMSRPASASGVAEVSAPLRC